MFIIKIEIFYFFKFRKFRNNKRNKRNSRIENKQKRNIDESVDENVDDELFYLKHKYMNQLIRLFFELNVEFNFQRFDFSTNFDVNKITYERHKIINNNVEKILNYY